MWGVCGRGACVCLWKGGGWQDDRGAVGRTACRQQVLSIKRQHARMLVPPPPPRPPTTRLEVFVALPRLHLHQDRHLAVGGGDVLADVAAQLRPAQWGGTESGGGGCGMDGGRAIWCRAVRCEGVEGSVRDAEPGARST